MALLNKDKKSIKSLVNICRLLLAVVMMLSGFLKAADPIGSMYKLGEYAEIFSVSGISDTWLLAFAIAQSAFEFLLGLYLFVGIYRRVIPWLMLISMSVFVPLSLYLWINGSISDCGCFGEAVAISNRATFIKNIVLLALAVVVFCGRRLFVRRISQKTRWLFVSIWYLPLIDSGVYATGENLRAKVAYIYRKGGEEAVFAADSIPGEEWELVEVRPALVKNGTAPQIANFSILDWEYDIEISHELLADTGYVCLVAIESVEGASMTHVDKINDLYDHCQAVGIRFCAATSSGDDAIALWRKRTGAEYPLYWADGMLMRSMIRSNPGLLLLKDGVVVGKWNVSDIPDIEELEASPTLMPDSVAVPHGKAENWLFWVVLLVVGMAVMFALDMFMMYFARRKSRKKSAVVSDEMRDVCCMPSKEIEKESSDINKNTNL